MGNYKKAAENYSFLVEAARELYGPADERTLHVEHIYGRLLLASKQYGRGEEFWR